MDGPWIVALVLGEMAFSALILWLIFQYKLRRRSSEAEERERLLARFGSGPELLDFLNSGAGDKLLRVLARQSAHPVHRLLGPLRGGLVLLFLGLGFLILGWCNVIGGEAFFVPGTLLSMLGLGLLVSVQVSALLLRRSGLLPRNGDGRGTDLP